MIHCIFVLRIFLRWLVDFVFFWHNPRQIPRLRMLNLLRFGASIWKIGGMYNSPTVFSPTDIKRNYLPGLYQHLFYLDESDSSSLSSSLKLSILLTRDGSNVTFLLTILSFVVVSNSSSSHREVSYPRSIPKDQSIKR